MGQREYQSEITSDDEGYYTVQVYHWDWVPFESFKLVRKKWG